MVWNEKQDKALRQGIEDKLSFAQIASVINKQLGTDLSKNACCGRANRLGLSVKKVKILVPKPMPQRKAPIAPTRLIAPSGVIELRNADVIPRMLSIGDLAPYDCRWPYGDSPNVRYCGHARMEDSRYCAAHRALSLRDRT